MKKSRSSLLAAFGIIFASGILAFSKVLAQSASIPIEHFIFIIQENHSFDSYFGTYPGATGFPAGLALADYPGGPLVNKPFHLEGTHIPSDIPHGWLAFKVSWDNGNMDGFMWGEYPVGYRYYGKGIPVPTPNPSLVKIVRRKKSHGNSKSVTEADGQEIVSPHGFKDDEDYDAPWVGDENEDRDEKAAVATSSPNPKKRPSWVKYCMSYMDRSQIPNYWEYADRYTLCDQFFCSLTGPSVPNHLYAVAAQSADMVKNYRLGVRNIAYYSFPSVIELLGAAGITWKFYSAHGNPFTEAIWNPLPGFRGYAEAEGFSDLDSHLAKTSDFIEDVERGKLPQVVWITPTVEQSEHPPNDVKKGMWYVTGLINAVMKSKYWNNCAIILTYDESGGFYDNVPPPQVDNLGFGFRVPATVISPYSKSGVVVHTQYDHSSLLRLIELKYGLNSLTPRDGSSNSMLECFDFSQTPLPPHIIDDTAAKANPQLQSTNGKADEDDDDDDD